MELTKKDYKYINNTNDGSRLLGLADGQLSAIQRMSGVSGYTNSARSVIGGTQSTLNNSAPLSAVQKLNAQYGGNGQYNQSVVDSITPNAINYSDDPYTKNPNLKPTSNSIVPTNTTKSGVNMQQVQGGLSAVPEFGQHMYDSWTNYDSQEDLRARYKDTSAYAGGIGYNVLTHTGEEREDNTFGNILGSTASGASVGSMFGPWGAVIGGAVGLIGSGLGSIFSSGKQKQAERLMAYKINNINNDRTGNALTQSMRLNYGKEHGDSSQQYLYGAKDGKLPKFDDGIKGVDTSILPSTGNYNFSNNKPVYTPFGATYENLVNCKLTAGEVVYKEDPMGNIIAAAEVDPNKTRKGTDKNNGRLEANDGVFTAIRDNGIPISAADAAKAGDFQLAKYLQGLHLQNIGKTDADGFYAKDGKLPKFKEGGWANAITSGLGGLAALGQYITASKNKPYRPNTYVENPYEVEALSTLAGLDVNPYPILQQLRTAETRTNRAIDRSGGLSTAQRGLGRLSALYGTQSNIANTLANIQQQRNQYKANYAQAALNAGNASRTARMGANQWDLDYYSKAHAARLAGMQTGIQNMLAQGQNWYRNDFKRRQFNDTMALYKNQQNIDLQSLQQQANQFTQQMALTQSTYNDYDKWLQAAKKYNWRYNG